MSARLATANDQTTLNDELLLSVCLMITTRQFIPSSMARGLVLLYLQTISTFRPE